MTKFYAFYRKPADVEAFNKIYFGEHVDLVKTIPGLRAFRANQVVGSPFGEPDLFLIAELEFDSPEAMQAGLSSPEAGKVVQHALSFAPDVQALLTVPAGQLVAH